jgi:hypothetical protein
VNFSALLMELADTKVFSKPIRENKTPFGAERNYMEKAIEKYLRQYQGQIHDVAIDDGKDGQVADIAFKDDSGEEHRFPYNSFTFVEKYSERITDKIIGTEAPCFPFSKGNKDSAYNRFMALCQSKGVVVLLIPSLYVARENFYLSNDGSGFSRKDTRGGEVTDSQLLSRARSISKQWYPVPTPPSKEFCLLDRKMGVEVMKGRKQSADESVTYPEAWGDYLPVGAEYEKYPLTEGRKSAIFDGENYRNTAMPFALLAKAAVEEGFTRDEFFRLARMYGARYKNKHQLSLKDGKRGSGAIFGSLFYHELVRAELNRRLKLNTNVGYKKQAALFGWEANGSVEDNLKAHDTLRVKRKEAMNDVKNAILWIYHRAEEKFGK